jgi:uncharacterized membrane protein
MCSMPTCAFCGAALQPGWKYCVQCGNPAQPGLDRAAPARWNKVAILAVVLAVVGGPFALVFGHIAIAQIRRTGERGRMLAIIATTFGYAWLVVGAALVYLYVASRG